MKILERSRIIRIAAPVILTLAVAASLWFSSPLPARAVEVAFPSLPSGTIGTTHFFSVTIDIAAAELVPIQNINLEIYNTANPAVYKATANNLPLTKGETRSYSSAETGNAGPISVTGTSPSDNWAYFSGTGYANWQGTGYSFGTTFGYGYGAPGARMTYTGTWISPSGWPAGNYQAKVTIIATSSTLSQSFVTNSTSFALTAPPTGGGGGGGGGGGPPATPGVLNVSNIVNPLGRFLQDASLKSADNRITVNVPADTIGKTKEGLPLSVVTAVPVEQPPAVSDGAAFISLAYSLNPDGATFAPPVKVTIAYDPSLIPPGGDEKTVFVARWDDAAGQWSKIEGVVDTSAHTVTVYLDHFSTYAALADTSAGAGAPVFVVSGLTVSPSEINAGQKVTIGASVRNTGGRSGNYTLTLKVNGISVETRQISNLSGNSTQQVIFELVRNAAGNYNVELGGLTGSFSVIRSQPDSAETPSGPAIFVTSVLSVSPAEVSPGQPVSISVLIANTGGTGSAYDVRLMIDNALAETRTVLLLVGESRTVTFAVTRTAPGSYSVTIDRLSSSFTVVPLAVADTTPATSVPETRRGNSLLLIIVITAGVIVGGAVVVWFRLRRWRE